MEKSWSKTQSKFHMESEKVKWELLDLRKNVGVEDGIIFKITAGIRDNMFRCHWSSEQLAVPRNKGIKGMQSEEGLVLPSTTQS